MRLEDMVVIITGAARHIGQAFAVVYLASSDSDFVTGQMIAVNGGDNLI
jgi:NAD(P)-dependent dehydrogenase (short-subunit alcohol dehydrogenase family)